MNRKEKIELLKGIAKGTTSIKESFEKDSFQIWFANDDNTFTKADTGEVLTKEEFEAKSKGSKLITFE